jgi:6-phosphogluconolactonase
VNDKLDETKVEVDESIVAPAEDGAADPTNGATQASADEPHSRFDPSAPPWLPSPPQLYRYKDAEAVADAAAMRFLDSAKRAVDKFDRFIVALSGGSTPQLLYKKLTEPPYDTKVPWKKTLFVFGDERCVPPDREESNYRMARETLFEPLEIAETQVLRMKGELPPAEAARKYGVRLGDLFVIRPRKKFDLILLGIGPDGHTASLFPGTAALDEQERWVVANEVPQLDAWRLTLTFPALNATQRVIFMVTGEAKAKVIAEAFGGVEHAEPHPCERVTPIRARREVLVDYAAASLIPQEEKEGTAGDADGSAEGDRSEA